MWGEMLMRVWNNACTHACAAAHIVICWMFPCNYIMYITRCFTWISHNKWRSMHSTSSSHMHTVYRTPPSTVSRNRVSYHLHKRLWIPMSLLVWSSKDSCGDKVIPTLWKVILIIKKRPIYEYVSQNTSHTHLTHPHIFLEMNVHPVDRENLYFQLS